MSHALEHFHGLIPASPVPGIAPVDGWQLHHFDEEDSDGFWTTGYLAQRGAEQRFLNTSRFRFTPSQDRFAWLVCAGFPERRGRLMGPWDDTEIEAAIAAERVAA